MHGQKKFKKNRVCMIVQLPLYYKDIGKLNTEFRKVWIMRPCALVVLLPI